MAEGYALHEATEIPPAITAAITEGLQAGTPMRQIATTNGVSTNTVQAVRNALPLALETLKHEYPTQVTRIAHKGLAAYEAAIDNGTADIDRIPLNVAILLDKLPVVEQLGKPVSAEAPRISVSIQSMTAYLQTVTTDSPATPALPAQHDQPAIDVPTDPGGGDQPLDVEAD